MKNLRSVFSTEQGKLCPKCEHAIDACICNKNAIHNQQGDGIVRIHRETKGRKGKGVCLVKGVPGTEKELKALAKTLKQKCGSGGALKDGVIEIQGDFRDKIKAELEKQGYQVKLAGG